MKLLKKNFSFLIVLLAAFLFSVNYTPGTYLSGWDNLQTELSPFLAVKRAFFSSWQEYQSMGLPAGMGHAADIIRATVMLPFSLVLPQGMIRYLFHFAMFAIAGIGAIKLLQQAGFKGERKIFALSGSIFYILNFFVLELMAVPFESFSIFFASLPWQLWIFLKILDAHKLNKKLLLKLFFVFLFSVSLAVSQQLFVVLFLLLVFISAGKLLTERSFFVVKKALISLGLIIAINAFWILPQIYFLATNSSVVSSSKANQLSTEDFLYRNRDKGNLKDFLSSTGFFYDAVDSSRIPVFSGWKEHRESIPVIIVLGIISGITFLGMAVKSRYQIPFLAAYILILIALLNNVFPFDAINLLIRKFSFVNQIFRSPFTKFGIPAAIISAYFAAAGLAFLTEKIILIFRNDKKKLAAKFVISSAFIAAVIFQALPAFTGNFFSDNMKVKIPTPYFAVIDYFKNQDKNKRIALLPEYTYWGWYNLSWGYDGSGFIWYGIEQPIISRTFDVWSEKSETYFWELKNSIEAQDPEEFTKVLQKYNVSYLLLDRSLKPITSSFKAIDYDSLDNLIAKSDFIQLEKKWDFLSVYKVNQNKEISNFVWGAKGLPIIGPEIKVTNYDSAYQKNGDYITPDSDFSLYYPFLDLTTQTRAKTNFKMKETDSSFIFSSPLPPGLKIDILPSSGNFETLMYKNNETIGYNLPYTIKTVKDTLYFEFPKVAIDNYRGADATPAPCINNSGESIFSKENGVITIESRSKGYSCFNFENVSLPQKYGYILKVTNKNLSGQRIFFFVQDKTKDQIYIEERLSKDTDYYILGNRFNYGLGYSFAFQTNSYSTISSKNSLEQVEVFLVPYDVLKNISIPGPNILNTASYITPLEAKKNNYYQYFVKPAEETKYIVLNQAYNQGWNAYSVSDLNFLNRNFPFIFGKKINNHLIANNWANAWELNKNACLSNVNCQMSIVLFYWPQYLQYTGLFVLAGSLAVIFPVPFRNPFRKRRGKTR